VHLTPDERAKKQEQDHQRRLDLIKTRESEKRKTIALKHNLANPDKEAADVGSLEAKPEMTAKEKEIRFRTHFYNKAKRAYHAVSRAGTGHVPIDGTGKPRGDMYKSYMAAQKRKIESLGGTVDHVMARAPRNPHKPHISARAKRPPALAEINYKITLRETRSLMNKGMKANIPFNILAEVYNRGLNEWNDVETELTREQYAFNRVNSFINGGAAIDLDVDLVVESMVDFNELDKTILEDKEFLEGNDNGQE